MWILRLILAELMRNVWDHTEISAYWLKYWDRLWNSKCMWDPQRFLKRQINRSHAPNSMHQLISLLCLEEIIEVLFSYNFHFWSHRWFLLSYGLDCRISMLIVYQPTEIFRLILSEINLFSYRDWWWVKFIPFLIAYEYQQQKSN